MSQLKCNQLHNVEFATETFLRKRVTSMSLHNSVKFSTSSLSVEQLYQKAIKKNMIVFRIELFSICHQRLFIWCT